MLVRSSDDPGATRQAARFCFTLRGYAAIIMRILQRALHVVLHRSWRFERRCLPAR